MPYYPTTGGTGAASVIDQLRQADVAKRMEDDQEKERRRQMQLQIAQILLQGQNNLQNQGLGMGNLLRGAGGSGVGGTGVYGGGASVLRF